jgi:hypothetical protein
MSVKVRARLSQVDLQSDLRSDFARRLHVAGESRAARHKLDFGGKSETEKSEAIESARQHRADDQNPIAQQSSQRNTAQSWLLSPRRSSTA